jgi:hypothetical protein
MATFSRMPTSMSRFLAHNDWLASVRPPAGGHLAKGLHLLSENECGGLLIDVIGLCHTRHSDGIRSQQACGKDGNLRIGFRHGVCLSATTPCCDSGKSTAIGAIAT